MCVACSRWSRPVEDECSDKQTGSRKNAAKRHAEPVTLAQRGVAAEQQEPQRQEEDGLEQEGCMDQGEVAVHRAEQDGAKAMTCIEANPGFPHSRSARDIRRDLLHLQVKRW